MRPCHGVAMPGLRHWRQALLGTAMALTDGVVFGFPATRAGVFILIAVSFVLAHGVFWLMGRRRGQSA
jgi:hypothetical protein